MTLNNRYGDNTVIVKGRCITTLTTLTDLGAVNILTDQASLLATPSTIDFSSSSAADTAAGVGARTLNIFGLGANQLFQTETITLNGQSVVTTANQYYRVFWSQVATTGTAITGNNNGDIYAVKTGTGGTYSGGVPGTFTIASAILKIGAATNQGGSCMYTTPNQSGSWTVKRMDVSANLQAGMAVIQALDNSNSVPYLREWYVYLAAGIPVSVDLTPYNLVYTKLTDIRLLGLTNTAGGSIIGSLYIEYSAI
jgi:hypothetical protein